jgi:hypothetical protein
VNQNAEPWTEYYDEMKRQSELRHQKAKEIRRALKKDERVGALLGALRGRHAAYVRHHSERNGVGRWLRARRRDRVSGQHASAGRFFQRRA